MKKKISYKALLLAAIFFLPTSNTLAASPNMNINISSQKSDEITDINILTDRANNNVNEAPQAVINQIMDSSVVAIDGNSINKSNIKITTQLLERNTYSNGNNTSNYAATIVADIIPNDIIIPKYENELATRATHTKQEGDYSLGQVLATIYFTSGYSGNIYWIKYDKIVGTFSPADSGSLKNRKVRGGYKGWNYAAGNAANKTNSWKTGSTSTITQTINSPKLEGQVGYPLYIWGEVNCTATRNTQSWNITVLCEYSSHTGM